MVYLNTGVTFLDAEAPLVVRLLSLDEQKKHFVERSGPCPERSQVFYLPQKCVVFGSGNVFKPDFFQVFDCEENANLLGVNAGEFAPITSDDDHSFQTWS